MRRLLFLCSLLMVLCACTTTQKVVDNTFLGMGDLGIEISDNYKYLGEMRIFYKMYRINSNVPRGRRPMDLSVFVCNEQPRRVLLISRCKSSLGWGSSFGDVPGGDFTIGGVLFEGWVWRDVTLGDEMTNYLKEKGYDITGSNWYKHKLMRTASRNDLFSIMTYVERGELESEEWSEIKPYVIPFVKSAIRVVGK